MDQCYRSTFQTPRPFLVLILAWGFIGTNREKILLKPDSVNSLTLLEYFSKIKNVIENIGDVENLLNKSCLAKIVAFNFEVSRELQFSGLNSEFNLRDLMRFCHLISTVQIAFYEAFELIYLARIRNKIDIQNVKELYTSWYGEPTGSNSNQNFRVLADCVKFNKFSYKRSFEKRMISSLTPPVLTKRFRKVVKIF